MGTPGVKFSIGKSRILESIKKKKGVVTQICADLNIDWKTYHKYIYKDPELKEALDIARNDFDETICDMAETALMRALNQKEDLSASLSSAKFVLNNKGKNRGYSPIPQTTVINEVSANDLIRGIKEISNDEGSEITSEAGMETQQSISNCEQKRRVSKVSVKRSAKKGL